jgi:hypothetical protein
MTVKLYDWFESRDKFYLVFELSVLWSQMTDKTSRRSRM